MEQNPINVNLMDSVLLPREVVNSMIRAINEIKEIKSILLENESKSSEWVEGGEARKMLCVSSATWQRMRDQKRIPFSQIGRKIYVKRSDIESYLKSHSISR